MQEEYDMQKSWLNDDDSGSHYLRTEFDRAQMLGPNLLSRMQSVLSFSLIRIWKKQRQQEDGVQVLIRLIASRISTCIWD